MPIYRFRKKISLNASINNISSETLGDIVEKAEELAHRKLMEEVAGRLIGFIIDSDLYWNKLRENHFEVVIDLYLDLDISPLSPKVVDSDRIAKEVADEFFRVIEREIRRIFE